VGLWIECLCFGFGKSGGMTASRPLGKRWWHDRGEAAHEKRSDNFLVTK
jgi:hypothetical protein